MHTYNRDDATCYKPLLALTKKIINQSILANRSVFKPTINLCMTLFIQIYKPYRIIFYFWRAPVL